MSRIYTVEFENVAVTAAQDFFELDAGAERPIEIVGIDLSQSTEIGDAMEEMLRCRVIRGHTTSGSVGGTSPTPRPAKVDDAAAGFTCEINNTTIASAGTAVNLHSFSFNVRTGFTFWYPAGCEPDTSGTSLLVLRLLAAPTDSISMNGTLWIREK